MAPVRRLLPGFPFRQDCVDFSDTLNVSEEPQRSFSFVTMTSHFSERGCSMCPDPREKATKGTRSRARDYETRSMNKKIAEVWGAVWYCRVISPARTKTETVTLNPCMQPFIECPSVPFGYDGISCGEANGSGPFWKSSKVQKSIDKQRN